MYIKYGEANGLFGRYLVFYHIKSGLFASLDRFIYKFNFVIHLKWSRLAKMSCFQMTFDNRPIFEYLKTGHVRISERHCICDIQILDLCAGI